MRSLPSRKCGLKWLELVLNSLNICHFPRGSVDWNPIMIQTCSTRQNVTSLAEVWIEIVHLISIVWRVLCHFPRGSVDWNFNARKTRSMEFWSLPSRKCGLKYFFNGECVVFDNVTSLAEVWIEIQWLTGTLPICICHFPRGSVDWNTKASMIGVGEAVTSFAEVWIEISHTLRMQDKSDLSLPSRKCGLKYWKKQVPADPESHFPRGSVDWNKVSVYIIKGWMASLPSRKCGLKYVKSRSYQSQLIVTSLAEVWIEIK